MFLSYRNQSINLHSKSIDWFLYEDNTCIYLFKVNDGNSRTIIEIYPKLKIKTVILSSLLLILNRSHTLFWCLHCWTSKCQPGRFVFSRNQSARKIVSRHYRTEISLFPISFYFKRCYFSYYYY